MLRAEMASKERRAASESGVHKALLESQGNLVQWEGSKGEIGTKGSTGIPGSSGPRGVKGLKGDKGSMGTKGSSGTRGNIGLRGSKGSKGENGIGTKGEKGDAANMDPRQRANWKQCAWKRLDRTDNGKIQVSRCIRVYKPSGLIKLADYELINSNDS